MGKQRDNGNSKNKVLVVAAHPDDEILGCGATMAKHMANGDDIAVVIMGLGRDPLKNMDRTGNALKVLGIDKFGMNDGPDNEFDSKSILEFVKIAEPYIKHVKPDIIYTHHYADVNIDHQLTYKAVQAAARPISGVKRILSFEVPSSTEWNFTQNRFNPNYFVDVTDYFEQSMKALKCYESELRDFPHPRSEEYIRSLAKVRGGQSNFKLAQAFEVVYWREDDQVKRG